MFTTRVSTQRNSLLSTGPLLSGLSSSCSSNPPTPNNNSLTRYISGIRGSPAARQSGSALESTTVVPFRVGNGAQMIAIAFQ